MNKENSNYKFQIITASLFSFLTAGTLYYLGYTVAAVCSLPFIFFTYLILTIKNAYPFRFMYPGLITFLFFMVLPIGFTVYIAFTNLSTGHLLTKDQLVKTLLSENYGDESENSYPFNIFNHEKLGLIIKLDGNLIAQLDNHLETIELKKNTLIIDSIKNLPPLTIKQSFALREKIKSKKFQLKNGKKLSYFRADQLIAQKPRYILKDGAQQKIIDRKQNITYISDDTKGLFIGPHGPLAPGYFTNIGLKNFKKLFQSKEYKEPFLKLFSWTFSWAFFSVATTFCLGLLFALVLNDKKLTLRPIYRILVVIPYSIPFFISVLIFKGMLNEDFGIINQLISESGGVKLPWLTNPIFAKISCLLVNLWLGFPYMFLIITGILQSIPNSIYEAADLDGAGPFVRLKSITLPLIMSSIGPLLVGSFAFNMNNFVGIYLLTGGGPPLQNTTTPLGETDVLISYTYRLAFEGGRGQDFALSSAISLIIFFIVATLTIINFKFTGMVKDE